MSGPIEDALVDATRAMRGRGLDVKSIRLARADYELLAAELKGRVIYILGENGTRDIMFVDGLCEIRVNGGVQP